MALTLHIHILCSMAISPSAHAVYTQVGFVPDELMQQWAATGFIMGPIVEWLSIDTAVANAVAAHVGFTMGSHVSVVTGLTLEEWEGILSEPLAVTLNQATKAQLRQLMT